VRRRLKQIAIVAAMVCAIVVLLAGAAVLYAVVSYARPWPVPVPATRASPDPAVLARGRYIVYGPGRCADCHAPDSARPALASGEEAALSGGPGETTYLGTWTAPNLTPDPATGIGAVSDGELARMLRYGVDRDGRIALPFMDAYKDLTEEDLTAVISFLRAQPAVPGTPPVRHVNLLGKIALTYFIRPYAPDGPPPERLTPEPSAAYGRYLAHALAGCAACHTARNLRTGEYLSPFFSGGLPFKSRAHPGQVYVSPNLTPDPETGHITSWTEDAFVQRFRRGLLIPDSPMPWGGFTRMTDTDLRALYRYLRSLSPAHHAVGPIVQPERGAAAG
jgi:mono/diheme cytochrome c family protein